jgi:hypothetical protein
MTCFSMGSQATDLLRFGAAARFRWTTDLTVLGVALACDAFYGPWLDTSHVDLWIIVDAELSEQAS